MVDLQTDPSDCGACGHSCGGGQVCSGGACASSCGSGLTECNGSCVNLSSDSSDCGQCGTVCQGGQTCTNGTCACPSGQSFCGGACVDTSSNNVDCGSCGNVCVLGETCVSGKCSCGSSSVSFSGAVQPIFTASCATAGCHTGMFPQQGMNLSAGQAYGATVNVPAAECTDGRDRVKPSDATHSYVVEKLLGVDMCGSGTQMPKTGGALPSSEIQTIVDWICEGAPNN